MGYIRDNEDYYASIGYSPSQAKQQVEKDKRSSNINYGFCNPRKAKQAHEDEKDSEND